MLYNTLPSNSFSVNGWLGQYLDRQISGITGNIEACGDPFNTKLPLWTTKNEPYFWYPYEQQGYWVDGALKCGYIRKDARLLEKAKQVIYGSLAAADEDGYIGPKILKDLDCEGRLNNYLRWPHAVFFRAIMAEYEASGNKELLDALAKHFKSSPLYYQGRNICSIEALGWLYKKTGDEFFKESAVSIYNSFQKDPRWSSVTEEYIKSDKRFDIHGVTLCEVLKLYCILYDITGEENYRQLALRGTDKLICNCVMVDGVISSEEFVDRNTTEMAHETCDIADFGWLLGYMFCMTGDAKYLDLIERMTYNAAPAVVMPDFRAIQYFSSPNLMIADGTSTHCRYTKGMWTMSYRPYGYAACCIGNVNRIMPNFISKMWHTDGKEKLICSLYGPCTLETDGLRITQNTNFPFSLSVGLEIECERPTRKTLALRIPVWAKGYTVTLDGEPMKVCVRGGFAELEHSFAGSQKLVISFKATPEIKYWSDGGVRLEYGPLLYAFEVPHNKASFIASEHDSTYPSYSLTPNGPWNYALRTDLINECELTADLHESDYCWQTPPISFTLPAEKIDCWKLQKTRSVERWMYTAERALIDDTFVYNEYEGDFTLSPTLPDVDEVQRSRSGEIENIRLIPYGCAKLRITVFPTLKNQ